MLSSFIAVVEQPACANVFRVTAHGKKQRLIQGTLEYCMAFADGYVRAATIKGVESYSKWTCAAGDAANMPWEPNIGAA